jgi:leucyl aminopeptidase
MTILSRLLPAGASRAIPLKIVPLNQWEAVQKAMNAQERTWAAAHNFESQAGRILVFPDARGGIGKVFAGAGSSAGDPFDLGKLSRTLPPGVYRTDGAVENVELLALAWCLEAYSFEKYGKKSPEPARLVCPPSVDRDAVLRAARAAFLVRDLVNTPASDMGPDELESVARSVAKEFSAKFSMVRGKALEEGYPMIHAVGQASPRAPRLIDFSWGSRRAPRVTLVGKGVCFDTGGLDIKPAAGMLTMKKDMGGAAHVLGLAQMIMSAKLPVQLRVLIPAVENSISGTAFRPGDILRSRKGITVEIGNTDAEGRLVLGDALALADEESPDLLIDMATLTGAARVALGPDLPPFYTEDDALAEAIGQASRRQNDPVWRMPLWRPYFRLFESPIADMNNSGESGFAGSITAALFLKRFVEKASSYVHFDIFAWTPSGLPGRPRGGEAQAIRALFEVIRERYVR